jgi:beta-glucosidase
LADNVTAGIAGINSASTFDRDLMLQRGEYMGNEYRAKGIHIQLGPGMNLMRSPEGGRGWESGGEDPFLTGVTGAETIKGIQSQGVVSIYCMHSEKKKKHLIDDPVFLDCNCKALYS